MQTHDYSRSKHKDLIEELSKKPSSFDRYIPPVKIDSDIGPSDYKIFKIMELAEQTGNYQAAITALIQIEKEAKDTNFISTHEYFLSSLADSYAKNGQHIEAEKYYCAAIEMVENSNNYGRMPALAEARARNFDSQNELKTYEERIRKELLEPAKSKNLTEHVFKTRLNFMLGGIESFRGRYKESIRHYADGYMLSQGSIDHNALWVEQGEVGFSDSTPLATDNLKQCILLIMQPSSLLDSPDRNKLLFSHIDTSINMTSLEIAYKRMPAVSMDIRLVGAKLNVGNPEKAISNLEKILDFLTQHVEKFTIVSADILGKPQPEAIIFNPQTRQLNVGIAAPDNDHKLRRGLIELECSWSPEEIKFAFDLTVNQKRSGVYIDQKHIQNLDWFQAPGLSDNASKYQMTNSVSILKEENMAESSRIAKAIVAPGVGSSINLGKQAYAEKELTDIISKKPKYLGEQAEELNQPFINKMRKLVLYKKQGSISTIKNFLGGDEHISIQTENISWAEKLLLAENPLGKQRSKLMNSEYKGGVTM